MFAKNQPRRAAPFLHGPDRRRGRRLAVSVAVAVLLWDSSALAFNAVVSQDLPVLTSILATELDSYVRLGALLENMRRMVASAKEYTAVAKTAWGAIDELRHMNGREVLQATKQGLAHAFPQVGEMYGDIQDIRDLDHRDYQAYATLSGMLWEHVYGPAIEYVGPAQENIAHVADWEDHRNRQRAKAAVYRERAQRWQDDCSRTASRGEGACQAAANRAAVQTAEMIADLHETALNIQHATQKEVERDDREELDKVYAWERWVFDVREYMRGASANGRTCPAGECLYQRYGHVMQQKVAFYRARHRERTIAHLRAVETNVSAVASAEDGGGAPPSHGLVPAL